MRANSIVLHRRAIGAAVLLLAAMAASCGLEKQSAPDLAGPSEFGTSLTITATPDSLIQDGASQSVINVQARDANGTPRANLGLRIEGTSSVAQIPVVFTQTFVRTDAQGRASFGLVAPPPPAVTPATPPVITVRVTPENTDFGSSSPRAVQVALVAPEGTPPANNDPVPSFTIMPAVGIINQNITFDASATMDEGQPCGSRCTYLWDFGDFTTGNGITVNKSYTLPATYTVTLTVRDDRGAVVSVQRSVAVSGPAAPVANFTVTPSSPIANATATFNASTSTVGTGATITQYAWDFGDGGATVTSTTPAVQKTYGAAGTYLVTLTVTDSLGRQATRVSTLTVLP